MAPSLGEVFYPLAASYQAALCVLVLASGRLDPLRQAVLLILGFNTLQITDQAGWVDLDGFLINHMDILILLAVAYVLGQTPSPFRRRGAQAAWSLAWVAVVVWVVGYMAVAYLDPAPARDFWIRRFHTFRGFVFSIGLGALGLRTLPGLARLPPGPLRLQTAFVAVALGAGLLHTGTRLAWQFFAWAERGPAPQTFVDFFAIGDDAAAFLVIPLLTGYLTWLLWRHRGDTAMRWTCGALLVATVAMTVQILSNRYGFPVLALPPELIPQVMRPLLLGYAMLRFDLFRAPKALHRPLMPATALLAVVVTFIVLYLAASGDDLATDSLSPGAALVAIVLLLVIASFSRARFDDLLKVAQPQDPGAPRRDRYRLALERLQAAAGHDAFVDVRRQRDGLGISETEHEALAAELRDHVLVPVAAVVGLTEGAVVDGRWRVEGPLGTGGQGRVSLAKDLKTGATVVVKEIALPWRADAGQRFAALRGEARAVQGVRSRHVAQVIDVVESPWQTYLVREYVPGRTLSDLVDRDGPAPAGDVHRIARELLQGVADLHRAKVLHLDIKPANVVLRPDGRIVLIDHGSAQSAHGEAPTRPAEPGAFTQRWSAPEQWDGGPTGPSTDLYQAAGTLFFLGTGKLPRPDSDDAARDVHAWPSALGQDVRRVLARCRSPRPEERPGSADDVLRTLEFRDGQ